MNTFVLPNPHFTAPGTYIQIPGKAWECVHEDGHAFWEPQRVVRSEQPIRPKAEAKLVSTNLVEDTAQSLLSTVLYEPVKDVFHTQHSTSTNRDIAVEGLVLLAEVGSTMHGVSQDSSADDMDEMGICIEPPKSLIGLNTFEQYEYRTKAVNQRSGAGDIDRCIYSLRKFVDLAAKGNPTVLMPLFADLEAHVRYLEAPGADLRANKDMFITRSAGRKFLGYLHGQRQRYLDPSRQDSKHASRPELIEQFGWDTKTGYHAMRLAIQGRELMRTGRINLPMLEPHREYLLAIRNGEYSKETVTTELDAYVFLLEQSIINSDWPDKPDTERINNWLTTTYLKWWSWKGWT